MKIADVSLITGAANLDKKIAAVARKGKKLDTLIHRTAVSCVFHAREHGDSRQLSDLINAMPKSGRRAALIDWVHAHVPYDEDETVNTKTEYKLKLRKGRKPEDFLLSECAAKPFWDFTPDRSTAPMTLERAIAAFERALDKAVKQGTASADSAAALANAVATAKAANDSENPGLTAVS